MGAFDVVVLGGGTAGVHVATEVAGGGKAVALVEAGLIGGESSYLACLPSNSLLLSAARGKTWEDAVARREEVTGGLDDSASARRLTRAGVTVIRGTGRITGPGKVEVTLAPGAEEGTVSLTYSDLVIATGCEPVAPPIEGLSDIPAWTTAQSLCSPDLPRRLIVLGGGPAGCELTQIYASFGSQVTLVEAEPRLLPGEPAFAGEILAAALRRAGAEIYLGSPATKAERTSDGLTLALEDGTRIDADRLLLASGRRPRLGGLGLDALGLAVVPGMALPTTTRCEVTGVNGFSRVWAAGDVTGTTYTHASRYQASVVAANICGQRREADYSALPRCVFTTPSVFAVGVVPDAALAARDEVGTGRRRRGWGSALGRATARGRCCGSRRSRRMARSRRARPRWPRSGRGRARRGADHGPGSPGRHHPGSPGPGRSRLPRALRRRRVRGAGRRGRGGAGRGQLDGRGYSRHQGQDFFGGPRRRSACLPDLRGSTGNSAPRAGGNRGQHACCRPEGKGEAIRTCRRYSFSYVLLLISSRYVLVGL